MLKVSKLSAVLGLCFVISSIVCADDPKHEPQHSSERMIQRVIVPLHQVDEHGIGQEVGTVAISESHYGLVFTPSLKNLPAGVHGFHLHQYPSCAPKEKDGKMTAALSAGGHFDPAMTNMHDTPWGNGHLGDLPPLIVNADGTATQPVLAPRLKFRDVFDHALMVHAGGDNHADHPAALGGGGARISCGVITRDLLSTSVSAVAH
jgi:superoxide dismutase, Cu-Zn family